MRNFRLESFKKIFSFIDNDFNGDVNIEKFDENVLKKDFQNRYWDGSLGSDENKFQIDFVLTDDNVIKNAVQIGQYSGSNYANSSTVDYRGETIAEAIDRLDIGDKIKYIVIYNKGYSNWAGSDCESWNNLIIYRIPEGIISGIILKIKKEIEEQIKKEIESF